MYKHRLFLLIGYVFCSVTCFAQNTYNFDFENINRSTALPEGTGSNSPNAYPLTIDSLIRQHGKYAVLLQKKNNDEEYGAFSFSVKPSFTGKKLTLKGYIRTEDVSDFAGLWMRVDGSAGVLSFDNMQSQGLKGSNDWKEYQIEVEYDPEEAKMIYVGGLLAGAGRIWIDNLHLLVDDQDYSLAPAYNRTERKADLDTAFQNGSAVQVGVLNKEKIDNLTNLGMIWGFLKYYHPAIENGDYNWDAALFRILPKVLVASSKPAFHAVIEKWIDSLGKPAACDSCGKKESPALKERPDYGWIFKDNNLGEAVTAKLKYIKDNRHQGKGYYIDAASGVGNPIFKNENLYYKMQYPDPGYRLLSLFRYWNMIQYFFPYKYLIGEDWNKVLPEFIPKFIAARDTMQYTLVCLELIARIHDTHANIWGGNVALEKYRGNFRAPIQAKMIENKMVVTGYYLDTTSIREQYHIGDIITKINGEGVDELIRKNLYLTAASNYETQLRDLPGILLRGQTDQLKLELQRDGKTFVADTKAYPWDKLNWKPDYDPHPEDSSYKIIRGNIGYLYPAKYNNNQLNAIKKTFTGSLGIIIDMRCYPSDFMPFSFGAYIKSAPSPFVKFKIASLNLPGAFSFGEPLINGELNPNNYKSPIVIIVNASTQSQAEYTAMAFQSAPNVKVIGSMTAGADGNISQILLPGGIYSMISGLGVYYPDGTETQRKGVRIDIQMHPTIQGVREGRDELLEKAVEMINKSK